MRSPRPSLVAALVLSAAAFATGLVLTVDSPEPEPDEAREQAFDSELAGAYVEAGCWTCHTISTLSDEMRESFGEHAPGARLAGPDLAGVGVRYHRDWHAAHFWDPQVVVAGSQMPAQPHLFSTGTEPPQLNELGRKVVRFMSTLRRPSKINRPWPEGAVSTSGGFAPSGRELFVRECAGCHGVEGRGDGPAARFFIATRKPLNLRRDEMLRTYGFENRKDAIYTTMTNGLPGTAMPAFGHRLTPQERADIAAWVARMAGTE